MLPSAPLAPWAQKEAESRGRRYPETEHPYRPLYARDRDRVIHCRAFRRLEYKTQVFLNHEGDHYRTRLTHSLEVAQIARTVSRALGLNGDLAECLALSHDLGHTPFGHLGEEVLDPLLAEEGGFSHNRQTLRIVEKLEVRYPGFLGLNLTWEVREGIAKHSGKPDPHKFSEAVEYEPDIPPPLEAQMIDLVDEIAYNHHDIDDGLESRLLDLQDLVASIALFGRPFQEARTQDHGLSESMLVKIALRRVIDRLVSDLVDFTSSVLRDRKVQSLADVRASREWLAGLSHTVARENRELKLFLHDRLYRHPRILEIKSHLAHVLRDLFSAYTGQPAELPARFFERLEAEGIPRVAADYIAGMTDRFALLEHHRLCGGPGPDALPFATR